MKIEYTRPPNFEKIVQVLPEAGGKGVIFCYGDTIYNPFGGAIPEQILAHETVHSERQGLTVDAVEAWWDRYLADVQFRLDEEIPAHIMEYKVYSELVRDRERRARYMHRLACRLASSLYGRLLPYMAARRKLQGL